MKDEDILQRLQAIERYSLLAAKNVLTINDVALLTEMSKSYIYKLTYKNQIPYYRPNGKLIYFDKKEIEDWMRQNRVETEHEIEQALKHQWKDAKKELPREQEDVILYSEGLFWHCRYINNKFIMMDGFPVGEDCDGRIIYSSETEDDNLVIDYWMSIPSLDEMKKEESK